MRVLFATSEIATIFKRGGLGDVSYALPYALNKLGVHVSVVMPYYEQIKLHNVSCIGQLALTYDRRRELVFVFETVIPNTKVPLFLFRHPRLNEYQTPQITDTFAFFSKAVAQLYMSSAHVLGGPYDIVHCNDWHTALIPMLMGETNKVTHEVETLNAKSAKTIITIHNLLYKGEAGVGISLRLGIPKERFHVFATRLGRAIRLLREGLEYADIISTVSPTYAKELTRGKTKPGTIHSVLKRRKDRLVGILNGIDSWRWDPRYDPALPVNYSAKTVTEGKAEVKKYLRKALGLPEITVPLFGFVGRLEERQKGVDLIARVIPHLDPTFYQLVLLGTGSAKMVRKFTALAKKYKNISFVHTFDERLARRIYAASDFMLIPSKFEPCGLIQMIAMRYGTIPIVRKTGGLADSVIDGKTGLVFGPYTTRGIQGAIQKALTMYHEKPRVREEIRTRVMKQDFSWLVSAKKYKRMYERLLAS